MAVTQSTRTVTIEAPKLRIAKFHVQGIAPLVIHRFSQKIKQQLKTKQITGKSASSKKTREAQDMAESFEQSRYRSKDGWDGFHAGSVRAALISACRLVSFKMTLAKLSVFVEADGVDVAEPQIPLIRINGEAIQQEDIARVETGQPYVTVRAAYHDWGATIRIRYDEDQFSLTDVTNLLTRVGLQVGIGEGRPDSKNSAGMGWGLFKIDKVEAA